MSTQEIAFAEIVVEPIESFGQLLFRNEVWDLSHLDSFAFQCELDPDLLITVVVLFSCHCFTHSFTRDARARIQIPVNEIYDDGREQRVLCHELYQTTPSFSRY